MLHSWLKTTGVHTHIDTTVLKQIVLSIFTKNSGWAMPYLTIIPFVVHLIAIAEEVARADFSIQGSSHLFTSLLFYKSFSCSMERLQVVEDELT